jgi:ADP-ribosyl-[dinitrogen reductase] hydrolase
VAGRRPADYVRQMGWVLIALQNAFYHLAHADTAEEALVETVGAGGDTDTNAAIAGALLGVALALPCHVEGSILIYQRLSPTR